MGRTLTEMLRNSYMPITEKQMDSAKGQFREWLKHVSLPHMDSEESTRQLLITLVDEP